MKILLKISIPFFLILGANAAQYNAKRQNAHTLYSHQNSHLSTKTKASSKPKPSIDLTFGFHPYGSIKGGIEYYKYSEPDTMSISGPMYNVDVIFGAKLNALLKTDVEVYYSHDMGENKYSGVAMSDETIPLKLKSNDYYFGGAYRVGFVLTDGLNDWATFYFGLGYRYLYNYIESSSSYGREQSYLYLPFGVNANIPLTQKFKLKLNAEVKGLLLGWNKTHISDLGYDNDANLTQKSGVGYRVGAGVEFFITQKQAISLEGFFDYWSIGESSIAQGMYLGTPSLSFIEPANNTITAGVQIGYSF